nr:hypothetical protein [Tanacetum cinerariifolium]
MRAPYTLLPSIEVAIAESIAAPHRKKTRSPSPLPSPPQDTIVEATTEDATLPLCKRFWLTPLHSVVTTKAMAKATIPRRRVDVRHFSSPIHHNLPLLVTRMARHEREIHALKDQKEELQLIGLHSMHQHIDGFYSSVEAS